MEVARGDSYAMRPDDLEGRPVSEEEAAVGLGFADVREFRRWQTEQGQRVAELENRLRGAERDRDCFLWHVKRMRTVLGKIEPTLTNPLFRLAVGVVCGRAVDWKNELDDWWEEA
jgi:hypothetical protein